ncbi:reverse transcriptase [Phytophthora cinnamomi]|uniref:reverse transcriptase n=1 Tax=Phytophthora cinnamomi TaxID=4785 RepID=UPI0035598C0A|nr:reverse transcriptase [Phytophthora cinnamomi]
MAIGSGSDESTGRLESYFQAAMSRFLREQQTPVPQAIQNPGSQDVDMESTESPDPDHSHWEYDPDELDFPTPSRAAVATTTAGSTGSTMIQRVRISAISDLKEFSGKDQDEDRARAWVGKVKSAFLRDQASDGEKCLTFADLLSGSARNWYRQLPRSTRNKWSELLRSFQIQYCGFGISVARQYYHARKRSDESALEYLHRLNVAGLRARLKIKDGGPKEKREHVDHFIETLGDQDLADRLTLLRLPDADELEEVLRALDRAKNRMKKSAFGSSKYRQKASATPAPAVPAKHVRAVQIQAPDSGSDSSSDGSDSDGDDYRRIYMAGGGEQPPQAEQVSNTLDRGQLERRSADQVPRDHRSRVHADGSDRSRCSHCGSRKHTELGCWRRLTCQKCGKRGHPADHCLFVCRGCGELHDMGKCPMEEFYNWIRQWYNPTKHAGMLPEKAEKISDATVTVDLDPEVPQGYWKQQDPDLWFRPADGEDTTSQTPRSGRVEAYRRSGDPESPDLLPGESRGYWKQHSPGKWFRQAKITGKINNEKAILLLDTGAEVSIVDTAFARKVGCYIDRSQSQECVGIGDNVYTTEGRTRIKITLAGSLVYFFDIWVGDLSGQEAILGMDFMVPAGIRLDLADGSLCLPDEVRIQLSGRRQLYNDKARLVRLDQHLQLGAGESVELPLRLQISDQDKLWVTRGDLWVPTVTKGPGKTQYLQITNVGEKKLVLCRDERIGMWLAGDRIPRLQGFVTVGSRRYLEWQNLALQATTEAGPAKADPHGPRRRRWLSVPNPQSARLPKTCKSADLDTEDATGSGQGDPGLAVGDKTQGVPTAAASGCSTLAMQWEVVPEPSRAQITPVEAKSPGGGCGRGGLATRRPDPKVVPDSVCEPPRIWALKATTTSDDQDHALADMPRPDQDPQQAAEDLPSPDPSTGPGEVPTDQGPTLYAQGAEDPAGVGQADQPVVLSESNQGDPAGTHASSDDRAGKGKDLHGGMRQEANQAPGSTAATNPLNADQAGSDPVEDEQVCIHESGDLHAEDVEAEMAVLPEVTVGTADVKIEDIQVGDPEINAPEEIEHLRGLIWKRRHLLIGKGNALPPAARGVVCDIDVGDARPIAQRVRKVAPQFREKLSDLIKGLLGAQIIKASISPWASPIVVIIKKNGVDIRLCIDYRLVNSLTRLMVYPMPLINDLLEDLDKVLWYCSLDMASGFWVVTMTDRARAISAFITPFGLFEWNRMPFGLKNAPQIYQRMLDNALYGFTRIPRSDKSGSGSDDDRADFALEHGDLDTSSGLPPRSTGAGLDGSEVGLTVNEAEYHGLLLCMDLLEGEDRRRLVICGDSNLVIRQVRGEIDCKAPGLTLLRKEALDRLQIWPDHELVHVKRDWNGSADSLASAALQRQGGILVDDETDLQDLVTLNRLHEILVVRKEEADSVARVSPATTRSKARSRSTPTVLQEEVVRELRIDRIRQAQDEEAWIAGLKKYLVGAAQDLTQDEARSYGNISMDYEVDLSDLLFYCHPTRRSEADRDGLMRLVIPETLQQDVLHHYHASLEGGHQGIGRTYQKIRDHFHWRGLYRSVQQYVGECVDCETGKGRPRIQGESPGNIQAIYPFQIIAMDHIPSLPKSYKGNTELLIWVDLFTGYVIAKASASRTAQTIAESYEECVFRRFGASEVIRHDREPGFMSDFFRSFNRILGQRQRATMAYRPQANGTAERMVQTATRALKMIGSGETPFYLVHGWDPRSTLEATIPLGSTRRQDRDPRRWRYQIQRYYQQAREQVNEKLREAISDRADHHNEGVHPHQIEVGSRVWLYLDRVKEGYARKLAHLWHGPFRVAEKIGEYAARIELAGTEYRLFPVVHVSKLKLVKTFPDRPQIRLTVEDTDRLDFDEALLPEDSWIQGLDEDEYEVEKITDMRTGKRTRYGRIYREFLVHWRGYDEPTWTDETDLNCGAILHDFLRDRANRNRFGVMQSHEE